MKKVCVFFKCDDKMFYLYLQFFFVENVIQRQKEVQVLWQNVKNKAIDRRSRLESAVGQQIFMNSSKNLLNWLSSVKELVNTDNSARDVVTAENLLKNHQVIIFFLNIILHYT